MSISVNENLEGLNLQRAVDYNSVLKSSLIPQDTKIEPPEAVFKMGGIPILTRKSLSLLIAKPKEGKTTSAAWIAARAIINGLKVMWIDTEQGRYRASKTQELILKMLDVPITGNLEFYDFSTHKTEDRLKLIEIQIPLSKPDIVIVDGVRDLTYDINKPEEATTVVTHIMQWANNNDCHILNILHKNKTDGLARGHLGSELVNKGESIITIELNGKKQIIVKPELTRGIPFEPFALERDENGVPNLLETFDFPIATSVRKKATKPEDYSIEEHEAAIKSAFIEKSNLTHSEMVNKIKIHFQFGENKAKDFCQYYIKGSMIVKNEKINGYAKYTSGLTCNSDLT